MKLHWQVKLFFFKYSFDIYKYYFHMLSARNHITWYAFSRKPESVVLPDKKSIISGVKKKLKNMAEGKFCKNLVEWGMNRGHRSNNSWFSTMIFPQPSPYLPQHPHVFNKNIQTIFSLERKESVLGELLKEKFECKRGETKNGLRLMGLS